MRKLIIIIHSTCVTQVERVWSTVLEQFVLDTHRKTWGKKLGLIPPQRVHAPKCYNITRGSIFSEGAGGLDDFITRCVNFNEPPRTYIHKLCTPYIQWNLRIMDTSGGKYFVHYSEVVPSSEVLPLSII